MTQIIINSISRFKDLRRRNIEVDLEDIVEEELDWEIASIMAQNENYKKNINKLRCTNNHNVIKMM